MIRAESRDAPDALVIGAGHNGLVCAFYLARAGLKVRVLERRGFVGGAAITQEFHPGFRNSVASYTVGLLHPTVIADLDLHGRGLRIRRRPISNFLPMENGDGLELGGGTARTQAEFARFSSRDAERLPAYEARLEAAADLLRATLTRTPPRTAGLADLPGLAGLGALLGRAPMEAKRDLLSLFARSARDWLVDWFDTPVIQAAFGFDSIVGHYASPDTPGSAYVLLHHVFGEVDGVRGVWGHAVGGMGAITQAMARACIAVGVEIETDAPVARVLVDRGRAVGVALEDGRELRAKIIAANVGPKLLYERMFEPGALPQEFRTRIENFRAGSGTFRMNVALSALPRFTARPTRDPAAPHLGSGIIIAPSLDYMDRAFRDAREHGWSREPIVEMLIPSVLDDSLAPPGQHVASLFVQHVAPVLPGGRSWDGARDMVADLVLDTVERFAPGFRSSVIERQALSPLDLERDFGLVGGDIFHGRLSLDQLWAARPVLGHGDYRGPLEGLYHCGAGAHPGGGVTGLPGRNAAREILRDRSWLRRLARH
jgi:phytoene dehydrogenase-like protein